MNKVAKTLSFLLLLIYYGCEQKPPYRIPKYPEIEQELFFEGDYPPVVQVTYEKNGQVYHVAAVQGQVMVMFKETVSHADAFEILKNNHTKIIAQLPKTHYYLVEVPVGKEDDFLCLLQKIPKIDFVCPNEIEEICSVNSHVLDNFYGTHGERVVTMMKGGNQDMIVSTDNVGLPDGKYIYRNKAFEFAEKIISNLGEGESVVINMSFGPSVNKDIKSNDERKADYKNNYIEDLNLWKELILCHDDKDFVIVKSSGNNGITNLEDGLDKFRNGLSKAEIEAFERHFILVSAKDGDSKYPNDVSPEYYDRLVTKVDISDISWDGTSFSSPRAAGYIATAADAHGMKVTEVLKHVRKATEVNKNHVFTAKSLDAVIRIAQTNASIENEESQNNNPSKGKSTQKGIPSSLVGTKWITPEFHDNWTGQKQTIDFVSQNQVRITYTTLFYWLSTSKNLPDPQSVLYDCYYNEKENKIDVLNTSNHSCVIMKLKYENGRLIKPSNIAFGDIEYERLEYYSN